MSAAARLEGRGARRHARAELIIAAGAVLAAALLHQGHHCSGDGCLVCLGIHAAQALLAAICGIAIALPERALRLDVRQARPAPAASGTMRARAAKGPVLVAATPVAQKVMLRI